MKARYSAGRDRSKIPGALRQAQGRLRGGGSIELLGSPLIGFWGPALVQPDRGFLNRDETLSEGVANRGHEGFELPLGVHDLNDDGEIDGEPLYLEGVDSAVGAEAHESAYDCGADEALFAGLEDDPLIEGLAVVLVALADEDAEQG